MKQIHDGHRERLRRKFLSDATLEKHELLELLLFYVIPRRNTNEIAHRLLDRFGSLRQVFSAELSQLLRVEGVGPRTALFLKVIAATGAATYTERACKLRRISTEEELHRYLSGLLLPSSVEEVYLLLFSGNGRLIHTERLATGLAWSSQFSLRKAVQLACRHHAATAILAHNHPEGIAVPSAQDVESTLRFRQALSLANVSLINHYIVCEVGCIPVLNGESDRL